MDQVQRWQGIPRGNCQRLSECSTNVFKKKRRKKCKVEIQRIYWLINTIWRWAGEIICNHLPNSGTAGKIFIGNTIGCVGTPNILFIITKLWSSITILFVALKLSYFKFSKRTKCSHVSVSMIRKKNIVNNVKIRARCVNLAVPHDLFSVNWKMLVNSMSWMSEKCRQRSYKFIETIWGIHFILKARLVPIFISLFLPLFSISFGLHILSSHTRCLLHCFLIGMAHVDLLIRILWEQIGNLLAVNTRCKQ